MVRVVDEEGKQLGVLPTRQALEVADERGYDLVEVARVPILRYVGLWTLASSSMRQPGRNVRLDGPGERGQLMSCVKSG